MDMVRKNIFLQIFAMMNSIPLRLFHASLTGTLLGALIAIIVFQLGHSLFALPGSVQSVGENPPSVAPSLVATSDDLDGDGIPNTWEMTFHHNPNAASDAGADFDNDGLTASEEYQLHTQTNGAAGNPLGKWHAEEILRPLELSDAGLYPVDINDKGDVLVVAYPVYRGGTWCRRPFVITPEGVWTEIVPPASFAAGNVIAHDFNDRGEVVGEMCSADWSVYEGFIWDSVLGCRPFTFKGFPAQAQKINNYGDWFRNSE